MNTIIQRRRQHNNVRSDDFERQRLAELAQERCGLCWDLWPASQMMDHDGKRRCPDCAEDLSEEHKASIAEHDAARIAARQTRPQVSQVALDETVPPHIRVMENVSGDRVTQASPLVLVRSGASKSLILKGDGFASTDTFTFSTGVSATTSLTGSTQWTLTVSASSGATPGDNHMTYNNHTYRNILRVG
jgi:hypothetical protein